MFTRQVICILCLLSTLIVSNLPAQQEKISKQKEAPREEKETPKQAQEGKQPSEPPASRLPPLQPENLSPDWCAEWKLDQTVGEEQINAFVTALEKVPEGLSENKLETAKSFISRIAANLKALTVAQTQKIEEPSEVFSPQEYYSLDDFMSIAGKKMQLKQQERQFEKELEQLTKALALTSKSCDESWIKHRELKKSSPEKYLLGLEIIASKTSQLVGEQEKRLLTKKVDSVRKEVNRVTEELDIARDRLSLEESDLFEFDEAIERARAVHKEALQNSLDALAYSEPLFEDDPVSRSKKALQRIQITDFSVEETKAAVELLKEKIKREFLFFITDLGSSGSFDLAKLITKWSTQLDEYQGKLTTLSTKAASEQELLSTTSLEEDSKAPDKTDGLKELFKQRVQSMQDLTTDLRKLQNELDSTRFLFSEFKSSLHSKSKNYVFWFSSLFAMIENTGSTFHYWFSHSLFKIGNVPINLYSLIRIILVLAVSFFLSRFIRSGISKLGQKKRVFDDSIIYTLNKLVHYAILSIGVIVALSVTGLDFSNLALIAGALSVGIGFGLQSIVKDFINGLLILFAQNYKVGDIVQVGSSLTGKIRAIHVQNTIIHTFDGIDVIVPNSELVSSTVSNWTLSHVFRRVHVPFSVAYGTDKNFLEKVVTEAAEKVPYTIKNYPQFTDPQLWLTGFGENAMHFELIVWINTRIAYKYPPSAAYTWVVETALRKNNIEIPVPKKEILSEKIHVELEQPPHTAP